LNPTIFARIPNNVTNMHICGHVFMVPKYNLPTKHPTFTEFMDQYYYFRTQIEQKMINPLMHHPFR
jgi:hypothetical protein